MQTEGRRESDNVEDRRAAPGRRLAVGGGLGVLVVALIAVMLGGNPADVLRMLGGGVVEGGGGTYTESAEEAELAEFTRVVLADTEDVWNGLFPEVYGREYREPVLVMFRDQVESACGFQGAAVGPFYCPGDHRVYIDLSFFEELARRHGAAGDFARAYVIAHEVGHHVQNLTGVFDEVQRQRAGRSREDANRLSVRQELQADYLAGVWAHHIRMQKEVLEPGDLEEALEAAGRIGDDTLQRRAGGRVAPDLFTHGTSAQRIRWFRRGYESGDPRGASALFELPYESL